MMLQHLQLHCYTQFCQKNCGGLVAVARQLQKRQ